MDMRCDRGNMEQRVIGVVRRAFLLCAFVLFGVSPVWGELEEQQSLGDGGDFDKAKRMVESSFSYFESGKYDEVLQKLSTAERIHSGVPEMYNLRGAVYSQLKQWDQAKTSFEKALELRPSFFPPRFNLAEILFMQGRYIEARKQFQLIVSQMPANDIVMFKLYLTYLMVDSDVTEAMRMRDAFPFSGESPLRFYVLAAWEFRRGDLEMGKKLVEDAKKLYRTEDNKIYLAAFKDLNW